jgi:hypothetical protein
MDVVWISWKRVSWSWFMWTNYGWKKEALRNKRETIRLVIVCKNETVGLVALL